MESFYSLRADGFIVRSDCGSGATRPFRRGCLAFTRLLQLRPVSELSASRRGISGSGERLGKVRGPKQKLFREQRGGDEPTAVNRRTNRGINFNFASGFCEGKPRGENQTKP